MERSKTLYANDAVRSINSLISAFCRNHCKLTRGEISEFNSEFSIKPNLRYKSPDFTVSIYVIILGILIIDQNDKFYIFEYSGVSE